MRHQSAPGTLWLPGSEDECAVSEALPVAGCSFCLPACLSAAESHPSHPSHPSGSGSGKHRLSPGTRRSPGGRHSKGLAAGEQLGLCNTARNLFALLGRHFQPLSPRAPQGCSLCRENRILPRQTPLQHVVLTFPCG